MPAPEGMTRLLAALWALAAAAEAQNMWTPPAACSVANLCEGCTCEPKALFSGLRFKPITAVHCAQGANTSAKISQGAACEIERLSLQPASVPWDQMVLPKPALGRPDAIRRLTVRLNASALSCDCRNAWLRSAALDAQLLAAEGTQCEEETAFCGLTPRLLSRLPRIEIGEAATCDDAGTLRSANDFYSKCSLPVLQSSGSGCSVSLGCLRPFATSFRAGGSPLYARMRFQYRAPQRDCIRSVSLDLAGAAFNESGWLVCAQVDPAFPPLKSLLKVLIEGPPEVLSATATQLRSLDELLNISLAAAPLPSRDNISWFFYSSRAGGLWEWGLDLDPELNAKLRDDPTDWRLHLNVQDSGTPHDAFTRRNLLLSLRHPDLKCVHGVYRMRACNPHGCANHTFRVNTTRRGAFAGETCARVNKTFLVTDIRVLREPPPPPPPPPPLMEPAVKEPSTTPWVIGGALSMVALCAATSLCALLRLRSRRRLLREMERVKPPDEACLLAPLSGPQLLHNPSYMTWLQTLKSLKSVPCVGYEKLAVMKRIGAGAFGEVFLVSPKEEFAQDEDLQGLLEGATRVALKKLRPGCGLSPEATELEREATTLLHLSHPSIVRFFGLTLIDGDASAGPSAQPHFGLLFEFMAEGDLVTYLRAHNGALTAGVREPDYEELVGVALSVAQGLAYLAARDLVHRDLAARNCLVRVEAGGQLTAKISDFGMSRELPGNSYYRMGNDTLVPVRWLPPEALLYRKFTLESDVWAFGVLLWEIFSLGQVPWAEYSNCQVLEVIKSGASLPRPPRCPAPFFAAVLARCWEAQPADRPTASQLATLLGSFSAQSAYVRMRDPAGPSTSREEPDFLFDFGRTPSAGAIITSEDIRGRRSKSPPATPAGHLQPSSGGGAVVVSDVSAPVASVI